MKNIKIKRYSGGLQSQKFRAMSREKQPTGSRAETGNTRAHALVILETCPFFTSVVAHQPKRISMSAKYKPVINN
jgi:hypothetical protein